ncbi:MAG TPA: toprim domain-containing protein, partial [Myxococcota bacterium]|nr:toprim domain-containing protein [Myxococcota bacterium]
MGKSLIIVESPAKAATIKKYLDNTYEVEASAGHIKDLPERTLGVDVDQGFAPHFEVVQGKRKIVDKLKKAAAAADTVYLAPDPDREGEAIAWHIFEEIEGVAPRIERVLFTEITRDAVRKALQYPRELDKLMYESQLARRILDRLVGY